MCVEITNAPKTLVDICRIMDICRGFWAVAAREKYPGLILLAHWHKETHGCVFNTVATAVLVLKQRVVMNNSQ